MKIRLTAIILMIASAAYAQTYTKTGITSVRLRNSGAVIHNNQVTGYYMFYNLEKVKGNLNNYMLTLTDENLKEINSVVLTRTNTFSIIESSYNGKTFAVLGYDTRKKMMEVIAYDSTLKQSASVTRLIRGNNLLMAYGAAVSDNEPEQRFLVPVSGKGFLLYSVNESRKAHYKVEFLNNDMKVVWADEAAADAGIEVGFELFQDDETIGSLIEKRERASSRNLEYDLLVNDTKTGRRLFKASVVTDKYNIAVADVRHDTVNNQYIAFGEYYAESDRETKDRSRGFMSITFDETGKKIAQNQTSWEDMSKVAPVDERGKFDGSNTNIVFHNTIRSSDGSIFLIGEQYKKAASAAGIATNVATVLLAGRSYTSNVQVNIYNLVVFQFNPDYTINKVHVFDKNKSSFQLPQGFLYYSHKVISNYAKAIGAFDYRFTQVSADNSTFIVNYVDYDRGAQGGRAFVIGSIVYTPEKTLVTDKFNIQKRSSEFQVFRAKPGYILVTEYFRKEKKLESRLEKVNY